MIYLLQPPRHSIVSGGYRYNAEVGKRLWAAGEGQLEEVTGSELEQVALARGLDEPDCTLVYDSAWLPQVDPSWLPRVAAVVDTRLLLHYLPSQNPLLTQPQREAAEVIERAWVAGVGGVICTSSVTAQQVSQMTAGCVGLQTCVTVARPGLDDCFEPGGSPDPAQQSDVWTVVSVGPLRPEKGQAELAAALTSLRQQEVGPIRLVLIGDDRADLAYTERVQQAAMGLNLVMTGCVSPARVADELRAADLYASASLFESYGMAIREALATATPVVSYRTGEVEDWVTEGGNGFVVDVGDRHGLRDRLKAARATTLQKRDDLQRRSWDETTKTLRQACAGAGPERSTEGHVQLYSSCRLPTVFGDFALSVYQVDRETEAVLIAKGDLRGAEPPFVRVHSECYTGEVLSSLRCDCRAQLENALKRIATEGRGAVVYLRQEGRGIGLGNKIRAYAEQDKGADTVEANKILGFPVDLRDFTAAARILLANGVTAVRLNTNNPAKATSLKANGVQIRELIPSSTPPNPHNLDYLRTKFESLGHAGLGPVLRILDDSG